MPRFNFASKPDPEKPAPEKQDSVQEPTPTADPGQEQPVSPPAEVTPPRAEPLTEEEPSSPSPPVEHSPPPAQPATNESQASAPEVQDRLPSTEESTPDEYDEPGILDPEPEAAAIPSPETLAMDDVIPAEFRKAIEPGLKDDGTPISDTGEDLPAEILAPPVEEDKPRQKKSKVDFDNPFDKLEDKNLFLGEDFGDQDTEAQLADDMADSDDKRSNAPLVAFIAIVGFLLAIAVVWFFNPYPPLRSFLEQLLKRPEEIRIVDASKAPPAIIDTVTDAVIENDSIPREWNYYLQVSAFNEQYKAQDDANSYKRLGISARVDGEYIQGQRRTYYRVRIGPYLTPGAALAHGDSLKAIIPSKAFLDSIRVEDDVELTSETATIVQPLLKKPRRKPAGRPVQAATPLVDNKAKTPTPSGASSGFAVHVSSLQQLTAAQNESRKLINRGLPAYTVKAMANGKPWYRVLVGPFRTRQEADRYLSIVQKEFEKAAYVRKLGS